MCVFATAEKNTKGIVPMNSMNHIPESLFKSAPHVVMQDEKRCVQILRIISPEYPQIFLFTSRYDSLSLARPLAHNYNVCVNELITRS